MKKYKNKITGKIALVFDNKAAGMCEKTRGKTFVVFYYQGEAYGYCFVMESTEFHKTYSELPALSEHHGSDGMDK